MSHVTTQSKQAEFQRYLQEKNVHQSITRALTALYDKLKEDEPVEDPVVFIAEHLLGQARRT